jgi:transaldolase
VAQAGLAYKLYQKKFSGPRWEALVKKGAKKQRLLWASTSVKNPAYPDTLYVAPLIGPDTVSHLVSQKPVCWIYVDALHDISGNDISSSRGLFTV